MKTPEDPKKRTLLTVVLAVVGAWVWFAPPQALLPRDTPLSPEEQAENGLRMDMFKTASDVDWFHSRTDSLPATLADIGRTGRDIRYQILSIETYRLEGRRDGLRPISWVSSEGVGSLIAPVLSTR